MQSISGLDGKYKDTPLQVVGSGVSLARLRHGHFVASSPVVAVNYAITVVESLGLPNPLYSMQKDHVYLIPQAALLLHTVESAREYEGSGENVYLFDMENDFAMPWNAPSVVACLGLAKRMGCSRVMYLCCDASLGITEKYQLGEVIAPENAADYLMHPILVQQYASDLSIPVEWVTI